MAAGEDRFIDVTTEELIDEIDRRCDAFVIGCIFKAKQTIPGASHAWMEYGGGFHTALGLAEQLKSDLMNRELGDDTRSKKKK